MGRNKGGERGREIRHLVTESGGALLFLHRFLVDQSPSVTARKKRFMHKGFNVFSPVKIKEREKKKKKKWHSSFHVV